jgi:SAM-dependent methyltransferase
LISQNNEIWPIEDLETLGCCPVCSCKGSKSFSDLTDIVFNCAPGKWTFNSCDSCKTGYLDPRPNRQSIGRAYEIYYTHGELIETTESQLLPRGGLLRSAINGRLNFLYGTNRMPSSPLLGRILNLLPFIGSFFDPLGRSIQRPPHAHSTLLDFGCGDGRFLSFATEMGWKCVGVDFDSNAVAASKKLGLDVRLGGMDALKSDERFDAITMSHVIEHVHDPVETLLSCYRLLNSGGKIIIETPNFEAFGRYRYGKFWRTSRQFISLSMHAESRRLRYGLPTSRKSLRQLLNGAAMVDGVKALFTPKHTEFLRFVASKP